jgi:hypothetical protein
VPPCCWQPEIAYQTASVVAGLRAVVLVARRSSRKPRAGAAASVPSLLTEATNFLNSRIRGRTLAEARQIETALTRNRVELDQLAQKVMRPAS